MPDDRKILQEILSVLEHVERLDKLESDRSARMSALAKRARSGEVITEQERRATFDVTVVDYGDVWVDLRRLAPKVRKALKGKA